MQMSLEGPGLPAFQERMKYLVGIALITRRAFPGVERRALAVAMGTVGGRQCQEEEGEEISALGVIWV